MFPAKCSQGIRLVLKATGDSRLGRRLLPAKLDQLGRPHGKVHGLLHMQRYGEGIWGGGLVALTSLADGAFRQQDLGNGHTTVMQALHC